MLILFFLTLLINNLYLEAGLIPAAFLLTWFATRKWKLCFTGLAIFIAIGGSLFALDHFVLKSVGNEMVLLISIILSGIAFAYHIYIRKSVSVLVIYFFLLGSVLYINSVDYAFDNLLAPPERKG